MDMDSDKKRTRVELGICVSVGGLGTDEENGEHKTWEVTEREALWELAETIGDIEPPGWNC